KRPNQPSPLPVVGWVHEQCCVTGSDELTSVRESRPLFHDWRMFGRPWPSAVKSSGLDGSLPQIEVEALFSHRRSIIHERANFSRRGLDWGEGLSGLSPTGMLAQSPHGWVH